MELGRETEAPRRRVELVAAGTTLRSLFADAGLALAEAIAGTRLPPASTAEYDVVMLQADSREELLAKWLLALVELARDAGKLLTTFQLEHLTDQTLVGSARGVEVASDVIVPPNAAVRSIRMTAGAEGLTARVVVEL